MSKPILFTPLQIRDVTLKNRITDFIKAQGAAGSGWAKFPKGNSKGASPRDNPQEATPVAPRGNPR